MSTTPQEEGNSKEIVSRPNHLRFISAEIENFAGISMSDKSLVIVFPENERIVEVSGDQGVGKTSLLNGLKALMGYAEPENAVNVKTGSKGEALTFEYDGEQYKSRLTTKTFSLSNVKEVGGKVSTSTISKPKDMLTTFIGPLGISPDFISKKKSGEAQIEWIKQLASSNPELTVKENQIKLEYDNAYKQRTEVNRDVKTLRDALVQSGYFTWDATNSVLVATAEYKSDQQKSEGAPDNAEELNTKYEFAKKLANERLLAIDRKAQLESDKKKIEKSITDINDKIAALQAEKIAAESSLEKCEESIDKATVYIQERENGPELLKEAEEQLKESGTIAQIRQALKTALTALDTHQKKEDLQKELNTTIDNAHAKLRDLAKEFTPDIEGLEIELGGNIDNTRPLGVYYKGINIAHLSESELWDLCLQAWRVSGISVVFIENSSSLGSDAVKRINWFVQNGGYCFISTMARGYKELTVSFHKELS